MRAREGAYARSHAPSKRRASQKGSMLNCYEYARRKLRSQQGWEVEHTLHHHCSAWYWEESMAFSPPGWERTWNPLYLQSGYLPDRGRNLTLLWSIVFVLRDGSGPVHHSHSRPPSHTHQCVHCPFTCVSNVPACACHTSTHCGACFPRTDASRSLGRSVEKSLQ